MGLIHTAGAHRIVQDAPRRIVLGAPTASPSRAAGVLVMIAGMSAGLWQGQSKAAMDATPGSQLARSFSLTDGGLVLHSGGSVVGESTGPGRSGPGGSGVSGGGVGAGPAGSGGVGVGERREPETAGTIGTDADAGGTDMAALDAGRFHPAARMPA